MTEKQNTFQVEFEPMGIRGECPSGGTLLDCARKLRVELVSVCGGRGTCGHCVVRVLQGDVSAVDNSERKFINSEMLAKGYRLACRTRLLGSCKISVPPQSLSAMQRLQVEGKEIPVKPAPVVAACNVNVLSPSLQDVRADLERLEAAVAEQCSVSVVTADLEVLRRLSPELRKNNMGIRLAIRENEIIGCLSLSSTILGLAVDLGTTKIAVYLMDLASGRTLNVRGVANPQSSYGGDIISRMVAALRSPIDSEKLQIMVVELLNEAAAEMCKELNLSTEWIVDAVVVGNTAMHHLFLRLPVEQLALAPYVPAVSSALDIKAREVGLKFATGAYVHLLPNIAGYVGADHVAMLLASDIFRKDGVVLAIDIGTNTEMCLSNRHALTSLSCASGPAFEGAHITHGMRVAEGAIEHLRISKNRIEYQTIGGKPPVGICGSGIIDILAQLFLAGAIDSGGRMIEHPMLREVNGMREFVITAGQDDYPDITFTQRDVRELQLAKGAIMTGIQVLLRESGVVEQDISEVIIAGAFGTYIDIDSAIAIGMLPDLPRERFHQVGNAAGMGAKMALISRDKRLEARDIARQIRYIELASYPDFNKIFAKSVIL